MTGDQFEKWLRNIYATQEAEISCTECFDLVSGLVEVEARGETFTAKLLQVKQHLAQCQACRDEYEALRDLRRLEDEGEFPSLDDLQDSIH
ncbi:MAG TPA: hypothetical protein VFR47_12295 [Anaerolineales bacterium]|nr:hypothetical protein [Anaerolineales bacterium]